MLRFPFISQKNRFVVVAADIIFIIFKMVGVILSLPRFINMPN